MTTEKSPTSAPAPQRDATSQASQTNKTSVAVVGAVVVLLAVVVVVWAAAPVISGTLASATPTAAGTATPTPAPRLVYQSDWSQGDDGWVLPAGAKIADGKLTIHTPGPLLVPIPYTVTTRDYVLEMDYQMQGNEKGSRFGFTAQDASGGQQYQLFFQCTSSTVLPTVDHSTQNYSDGRCPGTVFELSAGKGYWAMDYEITPGAKTFRAEAHDNTVFMCVLTSDCLEPITGSAQLVTSPHLYIDVRAITLVITQVRVYTF